MAYKESFQDYQNEQMLWDFRQFYVQYVALYLKDIKIAEDEKNYKNLTIYYDRLHGVIYGRIKKPSDKEDKQYNILKKNLLLTFNKYEAVYRRMSNDSEGITEIENAFNQIKIYLINLMESKGMFGTKKQDYTSLD